MNDNELKALRKQVSSKKRIAMEKASMVHDLVEDRLLTDYAELIALAEQTVKACEDWAEIQEKYKTESA